MLLVLAIAYVAVVGCLFVQWWAGFVKRDARLPKDMRVLRGGLRGPAWLLATVVLGPLGLLMGYALIDDALVRQEVRKTPPTVNAVPVIVEIAVGEQDTPMGQEAGGAAAHQVPVAKVYHAQVTNV